MILPFAMILDAVLGEPDWLWSRAPHPAVLMGRLIDRADKQFNTGDHRRAKGVLTMAGLALGALTLGWLLSLFGPLVEIILAAILFAQRALVDHVNAVARALQTGLPEGRASVAMIVSRDTSAMDETAVVRAAIESAAENLSDGVIAPVFWFAMLGLPGLLLYKATNTADSMIGYRTPRHEAFGWAAARLDDVLNLIPARLTALIITALHGLWPAWREIVAEARQHRSPNAGWPEAAMSRALGIALAGPRSYDGEMRDFPWVNGSARRILHPRDITSATRILWHVWGLTLAAAFLLSLM